jgi:hypothetical protein
MSLEIGYSTNSSTTLDKKSTATCYSFAFLLALISKTIPRIPLLLNYDDIFFISFPDWYILFLLRKFKKDNTWKFLNEKPKKYKYNDS